MNLSIVHSYTESDGGVFMCKKPALNFEFINPNSRASFEETLKKILLDKLLAEFAYPEVVPAAG